MILCILQKFLELISLRRVDSIDPDFILLVRELDADLAIRDGEDHDFYAGFNKLDHIHHVIVAYDDHHPIACGAIKEMDTRTAEIKRMYTSPKGRGKGIAGLILADLENWAASLGYERCILETGFKQPEAIRLYEKSGYNRIPNYGQYEGVVNSLCFAKKISPEVNSFLTSNE